MPSALDVAHYFVTQVDEESGDSISNLKLQKLLYYAQGFHLAAYGEPLFPERIKAWVHGPVVPEVYHQLKQYASGPVVIAGEVDRSQFAQKSLELLDEVYSVYGQYSAAALRNMSHEEPPWTQTPQGETISHGLMTEFFKTRLASEN
jgi:uncharacterized phage-associated protein